MTSFVVYSSRTCEGISLAARRRANGRRCADVRLVVVVHHGRLPRLVGVIHRRARVKEEYRRRVSPVADAVVDSVVEGSQPASSRSSRLEKHTNVPSATESRRSSVPLGMSTVAHQPTPAIGDGRNSVGKSGWNVGPSAGRPHVRGIVENVRGAAERKDATRRESVEKARRMTSERPPTRLCNTMRRLSDKGELTLDRSNHQ